MKGDSGAMLILNVQVKELFMCLVAYFSRKLSVYLPLTEFGDNYNFLLLRKLLKLLKVPWAQVVNKRKFDIPRRLLKQMVALLYCLVGQA